MNDLEDGEGGSRGFVCSPSLLTLFVTLHLGWGWEDKAAGSAAPSSDPGFASLASPAGAHRK